ncbi:MAG TPA: hypothetical protein VGO92_07485, partial [Acidimicrobiales bacterium]|jgi:hypothetical protein|nr:hypothetical protein [Acidimicrobiales bacterium]
MPHPSAPRTLVLHALRLKGFADTGLVAAHAGVPADDAAVLLKDLAAEGLAVHREGRITGWSLTPAGRAEHGLRLGAEVDGAGCRDVVHEAYREFLAGNAEMLTVCTDWQMRAVDGEPAVNDHSDGVYDNDVVTRLRGVDERVQPVCARLAAVLDRFAPYGPRLRTALERVEADEHDWFTKPVIDSYHTVWFELHEDLLCTLGIERSKEEQL